MDVISDSIKDVYNGLGYGLIEKIYQKALTLN